MQRLLLRRFLLDSVPRSDGEGCQVREREPEVLRLQFIGSFPAAVLLGAYAQGSAVR